MARRRTKAAKPKNDLGYDERIKAPEGADVEAVVRALLDVPKNGQAASSEPDDGSDEDGR